MNEKSRIGLLTWDVGISHNKLGFQIRPCLTLTRYFVITLIRIVIHEMSEGDGDRGWWKDDSGGILRDLLSTRHEKRARRS